MTAEIETHKYDVVIIGAGGAGLRAAIEARLQGKKTAIISKSLFGKAHTVMAEGGCAASMGNVNDKDNWMVHFGDTMRGGKFLNNWRMAELHAKEAPDRVWELETYGALFDRTPEGKISQRNFGGHTYPRLAHVGDRTGLELIRTMQQKIVSLQQDDFRETGDYEANLKVYDECTIIDLIKDGDRMAGAVAYLRESGRHLLFEAPAFVMATGGIGKSYKTTSNSWEYTGDGHALALRAGASLINMEFLQFHPTGMVWPPSVKGILVTESVRGDGGVLTNSEGKRFMFNYIPDVFKDQYATTEEEADRWYTDADNNKRPPELLPRDEVARAINSEVEAGRGSPRGGVYLDVSSRMPAEVIIKRLPSMHHQFKELADVDITKEPMEVGPTCHYVMGGIEVDPDTGASTVAGLFAAGECSGGMHGSNRLGGNSLSDLLVFGRRAGGGAAQYVDSLGGAHPKVSEAAVQEARDRSVAPFGDGGQEGAENPYTLHQELQQSMNDLVGIIREASEIERALTKIDELRERAKHMVVEGHRQFNPGWHLALDLRNMLLVSECVARAAIMRTESRGGHTRNDYPTMDAEWRHQLLVCNVTDDGSVDVQHEEQIPMRSDLMDLFELDELKKYFTEAELARKDELMSYEQNFRVWRGDDEGGDFEDYNVEVNEGEVVLDVIHRLQATQTPDLAVRWNCKAGKCGSCSAEINGRPSLLCMTRMSTLPPESTVTVNPMRTFPVIRDLVTDVSFNYEKAREVRAFVPPEGVEPGDYRMQQVDVERSQEFRKCIECFLCQNTCHVVRDHEENKASFSGPRFLMRVAELDMHPLDAAEEVGVNRKAAAQDEHGLGYCNITKCCTEVCPEHIKITDNALIPLKERVVDLKFDPVIRRRKKSAKA